MKISALYLLVFLINTILLTSCLSDIRPKSFRNDIAYTEASRQKAIAILEKYRQLAGGESWQNVEHYRIYINDNFYGIKGKIANPYPSEQNLFRLTGKANEFNGELEFLDGENKGTIWGIENDKAYTRSTVSMEKIPSNKKNIKFWIPTYQYFIEFPFRIQQADVIYHIGETKYGLYNYDLIFVSWKSPKPQRKLDQYIVWVNRSTGLADKIQYTIRDLGGIYKGVAMLEEYKNYRGVFIPATFKIYTKEKSTRPLHIIRFSNFTTRL